MTASIATRGPARKESSFISVVADLELNETASKVIEIKPSTRIGTAAIELTEWRKAHRNNIAASVNHAKRNTGCSYSIEVVDLFTNGRLFITALVTRTT